MAVGKEGRRRRGQIVAEAERHTDRMGRCATDGTEGAPWIVLLRVAGG